MKQRSMEFVGDLSIEDSKVLEKYAESADSILEFGVGGSTQIFAQCRPELLVCVETDPTWANVVLAKVARDFPKATTPLMLHYTNQFYQKFDLIFVDGVDHKRLDFAINAWDSLKGGGVMLFHDTRRPQDLNNVFELAKRYGDEVSRIIVNCAESNTTVVTKREAKLLYENWNHAEGLPMSAYSLLEERP